VSDARLRALARQALASGTPEARAALLRERLRAGELTLARVELAAYCGDEAALIVDGGPYTDHCYGCERSGVRYEGTDPNGALRCARCWDLDSWLDTLTRRWSSKLGMRVVMAVVGARATETSVREAIQRDLVAWALGDP